MKTLILWITITCALYSADIITAKDYKYLVNTSSSLQDMITKYHTEISKPGRVFVADLDFITDDGDPKSGRYVNALETKDGSIPVVVADDEITVGGKNVVFFRREIGADDTDIENTDTTLAGRFKLFDDELDIVLGINHHNEVLFETVDGVEYFSNTLGTEGSNNIVYSVMYHQINLNMLINDELTVEQTIASYEFKTDIGSISPKIALGINDDNYYVDSYLTYQSKEAFSDRYLDIDAAFKFRYLEDTVGTKDNYTAYSGYVELEKVFFLRNNGVHWLAQFLKFSAGVSTTNEFSKDNKVGYMLKAGLGLPKSFNENVKLHILWGISNNYYPDLQKIALIDQTVSTINIKIYF